MGEVSASKYMVNAGWDDVPHLSAKAKSDLLSSTPPYLRAARSKGIPSLGSGAIYPIPEDEVTFQPFALPPYWKRAYGMDVGWNRTAAIWLAQDPGDMTIYAYAEHYMGQAIPAVHTTAIKARGEWITGAIDPASRGRGQSDGNQLFVTYTGMGLKIIKAQNAVEPGIYDVWSAFSIGRLKIFSTLQNTLAEYRLYRRDEHGKIVKKNDHLMDALRYGKVMFNSIATVRPAPAVGREPTQVIDNRAGY